MSQYTDREVNDLLRSLYPPHTFDWLDAETNDGGIGDLLDALAEEANADGFDRAEQLALEIRPATADESLPDWESALALDKSRLAVYGTKPQRRAQLISRLRESGTPTPGTIYAAAVAIAGPTAITVLEHSRATLDSINAGTFGNANVLAGTSGSVTCVLHDNAPASAAGLRFKYIITGGTQGAFYFTITSPDGVSKQWGSEIQADSSECILFGEEFAGCQIGGTWTLDIDNSGGSDDVELSINSLMIDGIGRAGSGADGLGARIFEWSLAVNEAFVSSNYDRAALCALIGRWNPAHCAAFLALYQTDGTLRTIASNTNAIASMCVCGG